MTPAQAEAWHTLFEVYTAHPEGWALVGGQMVHSLCWEREANPPRPTQDADIVLDVRAQPTMLFDFTKTLTGLGYKSAGESPSILEGVKGVQHRWAKGDAQIDVLIPRFLGEHADNRTGVTGAAPSPRLVAKALWIAPRRSRSPSQASLGPLFALRFGGP